MYQIFFKKYPGATNLCARDFTRCSTLRKGSWMDPKQFGCTIKLHGFHGRSERNVVLEGVHLIV